MNNHNGWKKTIFPKKKLFTPKNPHNVVLDFYGLMKSNAKMMLPW
jgi:hypothetical protein